MIKKIAVLLTIASCLSSCVSSNKIVYLSHGSDSAGNSAIAKYESVLQPDDNVHITVTSDKPELAARFNLTFVTMQTNQMNAASSDVLTSYLIDQQGDINFPGLGKIRLAGLTRIEAEDKIKDLLTDQLNDPGVNLRILNYKVSVLGEVTRPNSITITGERITILEAIGLAGDLTIYGRREDVMILRESNGIKTVNYVDLTDSDLISSPYYYLHRNDVVYIQPNKTKVNSSVIGPNLTVGLSAISLLVTIIALSTR